ncbi:DeoR/GlpR family DNA-binding transcription regulator [Pseudooceanicola spongiae]|uniref:DeoR family transcriptional regulator n=1 Tax=Pseudooceanicola spongiae TaxID=2613965 RepID=A0A7L9WLY1_9RHOB|nr:DeoR/GlpR family DNA-binding transcription regulator [Pseudooceanicola spongiae]QOL80844.1 DeoR family transcriptional regulator [Pseudooceanicola spongiae]
MDGEDKKSLRQRLLMEQLEAQRYISLDEIARRFSVTQQTARRDIMELERHGKLRRLHGGAMIANSIEPSELRSRRIRNAQAKDRIGACVAGLVEDGASLFLDTGTTCEAVARALVSRRNLRVVSYSLRIAAYLSEVTDFTIAVPGGFVRQVDGGVFQEQSQSFISGFKFDMAILSVSGIDDEGDLGDDDQAEVETVRSAMRRSRKVLLAVDSSKFGHRGLVRLGSLSDVDLLVSDAPPSTAISVATRAGNLAFHQAS